MHDELGVHGPMPNAHGHSLPLTQLTTNHWRESSRVESSRVHPCPCQPHLGKLGWYIDHDDFSNFLLIIARQQCPRSRLTGAPPASNGYASLGNTRGLGLYRIRQPATPFKPFKPYYHIIYHITSPPLLRGEVSRPSRVKGSGRRGGGVLARANRRQPLSLYR